MNGAARSLSPCDLDHPICIRSVVEEWATESGNDCSRPGAHARTQEFEAYVDRVWKLIERDVYASVREDIEAAVP
jgi:hypothetical protein